MILLFVFLAVFGPCLGIWENYPKKKVFFWTAPLSKSPLSIFDSTGYLELRGGKYELGNHLFAGNVFVDGEAICDDQWGDEEAVVVCR